MNIGKVVCRPLVLFMIFVFVVNIVACTKRVSVPIVPPELEKERLLHVKLISGKEIKVKEPRFEGGFLLGKTPIYDTRPDPDKEVKISLDNIESIRVERFSSQRTIMVSTIIVVTFGLFYYFVSQFEDGFN